MATPLGGGLDLGGILQAAQLGRALSAEGLQQNQLALELQQLQLAEARERLRDLQDPSRATIRNLNAQLAAQSLNPLTGIVRTAGGFNEAVPNFEAVAQQSLAGLDQNVTPTALPASQVFLPAGDLPTFSFNPAARRQALLDQATLDRQISDIVNPPKPTAFAPGSYVATPEQLATGTGFTVPERGVTPKPFSLSKGERLFSPDGQLIAENPADSPRPLTVPSGGVVLNEDGTVKFRNDKPDAGTGAAASAYQAERSRRVISDIDNLLTRVTPDVTGRTARLQQSKNFPDVLRGDQIVDFEADLQSLKSNIFQNELAAMRASSKTGGAVGNVSNREGDKLEAALGALDNRQSDENLRTNLRKAKASVEAYHKVLAEQGVTAPTPSVATTITTKEQFDALPKGASFNFNGRTGVKN